MTAGEKVISSFRKRLGVHEIPAQSNDDRGGWITQGEADWKMRYQPWCGTSSNRAYTEADVDDGGIGSPSTFQIVANARAKGRLRTEPVPGCYVVWSPGNNGHVEVFQRWVNKAMGQALTVGGNTGDAVREHIRDVRGAFFCVPESLDAPKPVYASVYWWEDLNAQPVRHGLYATIASREHAVSLWVAKNGNPGHVRRHVLSITVKGKLVPRWTFYTGERALSPEYPTKAARDADLAKVSADRPGHSFRTRSKRVRVS